MGIVGREMHRGLTLAAEVPRSWPPCSTFYCTRSCAREWACVAAFERHVLTAFCILYVTGEGGLFRLCAYGRRWGGGDGLGVDRGDEKGVARRDRWSLLTSARGPTRALHVDVVRVAALKFVRYRLGRAWVVAVFHFPSTYDFCSLIAIENEVPILCFGSTCCADVAWFLALSSWCRNAKVVDTSWFKLLHCHVSQTSTA
mmetsp:Transcript_14420/g.36026  ORF Transcript_14420/g.36026 Transcript_14420/m.36026 type:complete len:200 (-) Transcript_14420:30-629(-)